MFGKGSPGAQGVFPHCCARATTQVKKMAAMFGKDKSRIQAILEKQLPILVPKLLSLELISNVDRDVALNPTIDSSTRAASLVDAIEKKIVSYQDLLLFVHILLSSRMDATDRAFTESLPHTSEDVGSSSVRRNSFSGSSTCLPLQTHHRQASDPTAVTLKTAGVESVPVVPARSSSPEQTVELSAHGTVIRQSGAVRQHSTDSEYATRSVLTMQFPEVPLPLRRRIVEHQSEYIGDRHPGIRDTSVGSLYQNLHGEIQDARVLSSPEIMKSERWESGIRQYYLPRVPSTPLPSKSDEERIEFSTYKSSSTVGCKGATLKGEGIQLKVPRNAIKKGKPVDVCLQACTSGPFSPPDGVELVSPVYLVSCTPRCIFEREVTLIMEHFVRLQSYEQCNDVVLLTSSEERSRAYDQDGWQFEVADQRPKCSPYTTYGEVELTHFCFLCFGFQFRRGK